MAKSKQFRSIVYERVSKYEFRKFRSEPNKQDSHDGYHLHYRYNGIRFLEVRY